MDVKITIELPHHLLLAMQVLDLAREVAARLPPDDRAKAELEASIGRLEVELTEAIAAWRDQRKPSNN
jgi:hypothetical protein